MTGRIWESVNWGVETREPGGRTASVVKGEVEQDWKKRESRIKLYCKRRKNRSAAVVANGQGKCGLRQKESWGCWNDECSWAFEVRGLGRQRGTSGPSGRSWQMIGRGRLKRRVQASPPAIDGGRIAADGAQLPFRTLRRLSTLLALM